MQLRTYNEAWPDRFPLVSVKHFTWPSRPINTHPITDFVTEIYFWCTVSYPGFTEKLSFLPCARASSITYPIVIHDLLFEEHRHFVCYWFYLQGFYILLGANQTNCFQVHAWNQCFPEACPGKCMEVNTSNLCFNYDDLLECWMLGSALTIRINRDHSMHCILHVTFGLLHKQTLVFPLNYADLYWWSWRVQ